MAVFLGFPGGEEGEEAYSYPTTETDGVSTSTSRQQSECERMCELSFLPLRPGALEDAELKECMEQGIVDTRREAVLMRAKHKAYLERGLSGLGPGFVSLDASRPWMVYWILHSLDLLDHFPEEAMSQRILLTVSSCQARTISDLITGGFGGGPQQLPHCAPMYASVLSLLLIGTPEAYTTIDRPALYRFFMSLKHASGGFRMHDDGEVDARGTYTVIAVASLLNMLTPELSEGVADFAVRCQTYEGGFGGEPWNEAHGGYTFCAFASLVILGACEKADLEGLRRWLCARQMRAEGGFQGRTNKLVDGCYSFWQGGAVALLDYVTSGRQSEVSHRDPSGRLLVTTTTAPSPQQQQQQRRNTNGHAAARTEGVDLSHPPIDEGDRDKTHSGAAAAAAVAAAAARDAGIVGGSGRSAGKTLEGGGAWDGLAEEEVESMEVVAQDRFGGVDGDGLTFARKRLQEYVLMCSQQPDGGLRDKPGKARDFYHTCYTLSGLSVAQHCLSDSPTVVGNSSNLLRPTNPVYNIAEDKVSRAISYFITLPSDHAALLEAAIKRAA
ncbi:unnamed protein product [Pylaiella littoralis]